MRPEGRCDSFYPQLFKWDHSHCLWVLGRRAHLHWRLCLGQDERVYVCASALLGWWEGWVLQSGVQTSGTLWSGQLWALNNSSVYAWDEMLPPTSLLPGGGEWVMGLRPPQRCSLAAMESEEDRPLPLCFWASSSCGVTAMTAADWCWKGWCSWGGSNETSQESRSKQLVGRWASLCIVTNALQLPFHIRHSSTRMARWINLWEIKHWNASGAFEGDSPPLH